MKFRIGPRTSQIIAYSCLLVCTIFVISILIFIIAFVFKNGFTVLTWEFLTQKTKEMGKAGGIFPSIIGTILVTLFAIATPLGLGSALYLTEYTKGGALRRLISFGADCLAGVPSIFSSTRTLAVHFYIPAREGISMPKAYGTATVLIISILLIHCIAYRLMHCFITRYY